MAPTFNTKEIALGKHEHSLETHVFLISACEKSTVGFKENLTKGDLTLPSGGHYPVHYAKGSVFRKNTLIYFCLDFLKNLKGPGSNYVTSWQGLLTEKYRTSKVETFHGSRQASSAQPSTPAPSSAPGAAQHWGTPAPGTGTHRPRRNRLTCWLAAGFKKGNCFGSMLLHWFLN